MIVEQPQTLGASISPPDSGNHSPLNFATDSDSLAQVSLRFSSHSPHLAETSTDPHEHDKLVWEGQGSTAIFTRPLRPGGSDDTMSMDIDQLPLPLRLPFGDGLGCDPEAYTTDVDDDRPNGQHQDYEPFIAFPQRGECSFHRKLVAAYASGAAGVIVWGNDDSSILIRPSADPEWESSSPKQAESQGNEEGSTKAVPEDIPMVYIPRQAGLLIRTALKTGEASIVVEVQESLLDPHDQQHDVEVYTKQVLTELLGGLTFVEDGMDGILDKLTEVLSGEDEQQDVDPKESLETSTIKQSQLDAIMALSQLTHDEMQAFLETGDDGVVVVEHHPTNPVSQQTGSNEEAAEAAAAERSDGGDGGQTTGTTARPTRRQDVRDKLLSMPPPLAIAGLPIRNLYFQP